MFGTELKCILVLALCLAASSAQCQALCAPCDDDSMRFDKGSGLCLPPKIQGFESIKFPDDQIASMKAYRNTVIFGFNSPINRLAITAYLYDRDASDEDTDETELRSVVKEILNAHDGAELAMAGESTLPLSRREVTAQGGLFLWKEGGEDFASFLWLVPLETRYLKLRATYVRPNGGEGEAMKFAKDSVLSLATNTCGFRAPSSN